jgi:hypothetical protein
MGNSASITPVHNVLWSEQLQQELDRQTQKQKQQQEEQNTYRGDMFYSVVSFLSPTTLTKNNTLVMKSSSHRPCEYVIIDVE